MHRMTHRVLACSFAACLFALFGAAVYATPASATTQPIVIVNDVNIRPSPDTSQTPLALLPAGAQPNYICYADGQDVQGTTKWFRVSWQGVTGYYSSVADDVPLSHQDNIEGNYGIPRCGTGTDINQGSAASAIVNPAPTTYDRVAAVQWALQNARNARLMDRFPDCTWFVSQALWYGGFQQTTAWNNQDHHGFPLWPIQGTAAATAAPDLVNYLKTHVSVTTTPLTPERFRDSQVPEAQVGDVIAYRWHTALGVQDTSEAPFDHLAFVTNIAAGNYPEVSEWGTSWPQEPYATRGWTWSENSHEWLQQKFPYEGNDNIGVSAILIHFNY